MRKIRIVVATVTGLLIGLSGNSQELAAHAAEKANTAAAVANSPTSQGASSTNTGSDGSIGIDNPDATVTRQPQREERPFLCFGDAACEREMARQKRAVDPMPLRPGSQPCDAGGDEGPVLQDVPGQLFVPGQNGAPIPGGPGF